MALIEAVLTYKPSGIRGEGRVTLGQTDDPHVLRILRDRLLREAAEEAQLWRDIDPGVSAVREGELERLRTLLAVLLPDEDPSPNLRPIGGWRGKGNRNGTE